MKPKLKLMGNISLSIGFELILNGKIYKSNYRDTITALNDIRNQLLKDGWPIGCVEYFLRQAELYALFWSCDSVKIEFNQGNLTTTISKA